LRVIFGIGNPGNRYKLTRHNAGFLLLDYFSEKKSYIYGPSKGDYFEAKGEMEGRNFSLIKPGTFVNNSGVAALQVFEKYKTGIDDFLVVCDDVNLNTGTIRTRLSGGDGGHNGLSSIIYHLNSENFPRIRIGVGSKENEQSLTEYVLSEFTREELIIMNSTFEQISFLLTSFIEGGCKKMLEVNSILVNKNLDSPNIENNEA